MAQRKTPSKPIRKTTKGVYLNQWLKSKRKQWFTLGDLRALKHGQTIQLLNADRNLGDSVYNVINQKKLKKNTPYDPVRLFKTAQSIIQYKHDQGASGEALFGYPGAKWQKFTFEPFTGQGRPMWHVMPDAEVCKLPAKTPVGWRGECITLKKAGKQKVVIADDPKDEFAYL